MTYNGRLENVPASLELVPCKHLPWWRRTEDVFSVTFFCLPRRLEDITARRLANTSLRRLEDVLEDVLKTSWKCLEDVLKTSWKTFQEDVLQIRLEDVLKTSWRRLGRRKVLPEDVFKTSSRRLENKKCLVGYNFKSCLKSNDWNKFLEKQKQTVPTKSNKLSAMVGQIQQNSFSEFWDTLQHFVLLF